MLMVSVLLLLLLFVLLLLFRVVLVGVCWRFSGSITSSRTSYALLLRRHGNLTASLPPSWSVESVY